MTLEHWALIIGIAMSAINGLALVFGFYKVIYRVGKVEQKVEDRIDGLEKGRTENRAAIDKTLSALDAHVRDSTAHVNAELNRILFEQRQKWEASVDTKLE